jgi:hypothetical protein
VKRRRKGGEKKEGGKRKKKEGREKKKEKREKKGTIDWRGDRRTTHRREYKY